MSRSYMRLCTTSLGLASRTSRGGSICLPGIVAVVAASSRLATYLYCLMGLPLLLDMLQISRYIVGPIMC